LIKKIGIVGLGLIGGSLAKAFNNVGFKIYGFDLNQEVVVSAAESGVFDAVADTLEDFLSVDMDLVYLATPVLTTLELLGELKHYNVDVLITDACSTKKSIVEKAKSLGLRFVGGHPIAGKETSGFKNSDEKLFENAYHFLTTDFADKSDVDKLKEIHEKIGMRVELISSNEHDKLFGLISHFPHLIAFSLIDLVFNVDKSSLKFTGGGFRDFTRIAGSDPKMWSDIFVDNNSNLVELIDKFIDILKAWQEMIINKDEKELFNSIEKVSNLRRSL